MSNNYECTSRSCTVYSATDTMTVRDADGRRQRRHTIARPVVSGGAPAPSLSGWPLWRRRWAARASRAAWRAGWTHAAAGPMSLAAAPRPSPGTRPGSSAARTTAACAAWFRASRSSRSGRAPARIEHQHC